MSTELATKTDSWIKPTNTKHALFMAEQIAKSELAPKDYRGKPANTLIAMQMGAEVGLSPMQAIQNIAVINGRPSLWGDALLGLCQGHPSFRGIEETVSKDMVATCTVSRDVNGTIQKRTTEFSQQDATTAGLWGQNTWKKYPKRMLQMRARGFALRDMFADVLKGIQCAEEVSDYARDVTASTTVTKKKALGASLGIPGVTQADPEEDAAEAKSDDVVVIHEQITKKAKILDAIIEEHNLKELRDKWLDKKKVSCFEEFSETDLDLCIEKAKSKLQAKTPAQEFDDELRDADIKGGDIEYQIIDDSQKV